jgi:PAS domain S-box-containing protein
MPEREAGSGLETLPGVGLWEKVVDAAPDGIFLLDSEGRYVAANSAFCHLMGKSEESLVGTSYYDGLSVDSVPMARRAIELIIQDGRPERTTVVFHPADGGSRTAECCQTRLASDGDLGAIVGIVRDISQETILGNRLWDVAEEHRAALDFALRTSLGLIKGHVYTLYQHPGIDDVRRARYVQIIDEEVDRLTKFTEDLLDYRRLEIDYLYGPNEVVDVIGLIESVLKDFMPEAERRHLHVETNFGALRGPVMASHDHLRRILVNLLQNAIVYTPSGGKVRISVDDSEEALQVSVEDNGPGIPRDEIPHIFERFFRGQAAGKVVGTGLGLAIAKMLAESLGGTIVVDSGPETGNLFRFRFPRRAFSTGDIQKGQG